MDESATGSANLWSGPRKRAGRFFRACPAQTSCRAKQLRAPPSIVEIGLDDASLIMRKLLEIHDDVLAIRDLLEDEDDGTEEDDDS